MNFDNLIKSATAIVLAAAMTGHLGDLQLWVWKAQAKLLYESRTSTWGSPHFFGPHYHVTVKAAPSGHLVNQSFKITTDRKIHSESRSN
jgi:hypothetical protein